MHRSQYLLVRPLWVCAPQQCRLPHVYLLEPYRPPRVHVPHPEVKNPGEYVEVVVEVEVVHSVRMNNEDEQHGRQPDVVLKDYSESGVVKVVAVEMMVGEVTEEVEEVMEMVEEVMEMVGEVTVDVADVVDVGEVVCTTIWMISWRLYVVGRVGDTLRALHTRIRSPQRTKTVDHPQYIALHREQADRKDE